MDLDAFAAQRDTELLGLAASLRPGIVTALASTDIPNGLLDNLADAFRRIYEGEGGDDWQDAFALLRGDLEGSMARTTPDADPDRLATWLATATLNRATIEAAPLLSVKQWVTMRDEDVRDTHRPLHGVRRLRGETYPVGGFAVAYPGQPVGPPEVWINCRCVLAVLPFTNIADAFALEFGEHDVLFLENRRTPKVVPRGKRYEPKPSEGRIVKRRRATAEEEKIIARGDWLRVNQDGKKPGQPGYMERRSKVRPQHNSVEGAEMADTDVLDEAPEATDEDFATEPTPFWAVLAPEGVWSGDKRRFTDGALTNRDLPLPLQWQKKSGDGHSGSVVVGNIASIEREGNLLIGEGVFASTDEADEVIGLIAERHLRGISVDVDDAELSLDDDEGVTFSRGRVSAATIVPIPAFAEAIIHLGTRADYEALAACADAFREYDKAERDKMADNGQAMPDGSFPIRDVADLLNAVKAVGRAKDYDKAKAHIIKRAKALGVTDVLPEDWSGDVEEFKRGAGWVTHPEETRRLHAYWTRGPGAAKIRWGTSGDFTRCTRQLAKYVGPAFLKRTCAQWHHDALGYWPGELGKPGNPPDTPENRQRAARHANSLDDDCTTCESVSLVASADRRVLPAEFFTNPTLPGPTPLTITDDGQVFGHLALWDTCHIGMADVCVTPPRSRASYSYFATGAVLTTDGEVPVGQITLDTGHADLADDAFAARRHYDDTGTAVADVAVGEDDHGIWFNGAMRTVTAEQRDALQAAALSGDWRTLRGTLELIAALAVNVPGFPVPRPALAASGGHQTALTVSNAPHWRSDTPNVDIQALAAAVVDEMHARSTRRERAAALLRER